MQDLRTSLVFEALAEIPSEVLFGKEVGVYRHEDIFFIFKARRNRTAIWVLVKRCLQSPTESLIKVDPKDLLQYKVEKY